MAPGPLRGEIGKVFEVSRETTREEYERPGHGLLERESPRLELEAKFTPSSFEPGLSSFQALATRPATVRVAPVRGLAAIAEYLRGLYRTWSEGPHGLLFMGLGFLLGPGATRRYYSVEEAYAIPMTSRDQPFVLGGDPRGSHESADLILKGGAELTPRALELFRRGQQLYARSLTAEPANWVWHEYQWQALPAEGPPFQLREGDYLALGLSFPPEQGRGLEAARQPAVLRIEAGDDAGSFRLKPVLGGLANFSPGYPFFTSRLPLFQQRKPPGAYPIDLTRRERLKIFFTRGLERAELLLDMAKGESGRLNHRRGRLLLERAVEAAEAEWAKLGPRNPDNRAFAGEVWRVLGCAYLEAGEFWSRQKNFEVAEMFLTRALQHFEKTAAGDAKAAELLQEAGLRMFQMYRSAVWTHKRWEDHAATAEAYEKWAEYFPFESPRERRWHETYAPKEPRSTLACLQRAAEYFVRAYGESSESVRRVREKIIAYQAQQSPDGIFR
ncbi:MAG: hypothetical protein U1F66_00065 [bacterium]